MASAPSCIMSEASAGVAMPPRQSWGQAIASFGDHLDQLVGRSEIFRFGHEFFGPRVVRRRMALTTARMCRTASTTLPNRLRPWYGSSPPLRQCAAASPRSRAPHTRAP